MSFFEKPILNTPYERPGRHWELGEDGYPTDMIVPQRRKAELISVMPEPKRKRAIDQSEMVLDSGHGLSTAEYEYNPTPVINELRGEVERWRSLPNPAQWRVTPVTAQLLRHWRSLQADETQALRPFFCQLEAVEVAIWLTEVAPKDGKRGKRYLDYLKAANADANPDLFRIALKLATGAGKTTVMAMLIAWQAINAARTRSKQFSRGFLVIAPGITIRDRLRVLQPNDPDSYYASRNLVPHELMGELGRAEIVITNYHAFQRRETMELSKGTRAALEGHDGPVETRETEGQMLARVMPRLMAMGPITVINDEAHHCYRERAEGETERLSADEKREAKENSEAARLWIGGIEAANGRIGVSRVYDLSATPFFLSGSGWAEGTLFPWVVSDFSLMDAIECGIVKLPRVPVADNMASAPEPMYRNLWPRIREDMPKGAARAGLDPETLPIEVKTALDALYGHYETEFDEWKRQGIGVPPVFIVVCNNTASSQMVAEYIGGYERGDADESEVVSIGALEKFRNYDEHSNRLQRPRTLLIDSQRIDSGEAIDDKFRKAYADEIEAFRREKAQREGAQAAAALTDEDVLREVLNTIGKPGRLGADIRCVVSVSMLTEGWDANTVTHILGLRAFGTRLICEQVMGRALRRLSYDAGEDGLFQPEYANIMGIDGLNFAAQAVSGPVSAPRPLTHVRAVSPERDHLEIAFPRVVGYRTELPDERLSIDLSRIEPYELTPEKVGATETTLAGIVGEETVLTLEARGAMRRSEIVFKLATHLMGKLRDPNGEPKLHLFGQCRRVVRQWLEAGKLVCKGDTVAAQATYRQIADEVCERILGALDAGAEGDGVTRALLDPFAPEGSTAGVSFTTSKDTYRTSPERCHVNHVVLDSGWEAQMVEAIEAAAGVRAYVKNHNLSFEVPYLREGEPRRYRPDFLIALEAPSPDGRTAPEPVTLVVEVKGYADHDAALKRDALRNRWLPAVNRLGTHGRWDAIELTDPYAMKEELAAKIAELTGAGVTEAAE